ncbi:MAG: nucleotidyl transferase AbiEii/AbiGii toxin family protein [Nanoarchaeota archaeon]|nr:nucleotidyl transferase AbiEii/AbiGii toxin family protein [Nanoarchaeota archaeon]MBU1027895.1 nucleotidyl transferase AbiEii/AbiGii toxin family protein [Nanoarchaeota archaeon]
MIPLILRLKKNAHKEIAKAQDIIVEALYEVFDRAVLHGGTTIWRCYKGKRFSEDVDVYISRDIKKINKLFEVFEKRGFSIEKKKIGENSLYSTLKINRTLVRFEALFKKIKGSLQEYETVEGNFLTVYTLTQEELLKEKISTYLKRLKIRDFYDVFFLLRYIEDSSFVKKDLKNLINKFKKPADEKELRVLIYEGVVPNIKDMLIYIKRRLFR